MAIGFYEGTGNNTKSAWNKLDFKVFVFTKADGKVGCRIVVSHRSREQEPHRVARQYSKGSSEEVECCPTSQMCSSCHVRRADAAFVCCCVRPTLCLLCEGRARSCPYCGLNFRRR